MSAIPNLQSKEPQLLLLTAQMIMFIGILVMLIMFKQMPNQYKKYESLESADGATRTSPESP